jgi:LysR family transcriptional regulator, nitrogen assimilation regulatory protein
VDLRELRYFRAIAECGTFSRAAAHLNVAQPALSRQMQKLEHELGVVLLRRTSRGVMPTEAGQALLQRTALLEQELQETRRYVSSMAAKVTGALNVAVQSPISITLIPSVVKAYRARYPDVSLHLREGYSGDVMEALLAGQIDLAVIDKPSHPHVDLAIEPLWVEAFSLVGMPESEATRPDRTEPATLAELAVLPMVTPSRRHVSRRLIDAAFERQSLRFQPVLEADSALMILELVKAGQGYAIMPDVITLPFVRQCELCVAPIRPAIRRTISIVTRAAVAEDRAVAAFRTEVLAAAPGMAAAQQLGPVVLYETDGIADGFSARHPTSGANSSTSRAR